MGQASAQPEEVNPPLLRGVEVRRGEKAERRQGDQGPVGRAGALHGARLERAAFRLKRGALGRRVTCAGRIVGEEKNDDEGGPSAAMLNLIGGVAQYALTPRAAIVWNRC